MLEPWRAAWQLQWALPALPRPAPSLAPSDDIPALRGSCPSHSSAHLASQCGWNLIHADFERE